jgi:hypothetical protein
MNWKTIGVGQCRVCGRGASLLKSHICPDCRRAEEMAVALRPRRLITVGQLDALPDGSVVLSPQTWRGHGVWTKGTANGGAGWFHWALGYGEPASEIPLPALLLYEPATP